MWSVDFGWTGGAHQAALSSPFSDGEKKKKMEKILSFEIRQSTKAKN